jgi:hypothetical protein
MLRETAETISGPAMGVILPSPEPWSSPIEGSTAQWIICTKFKFGCSNARTGIAADGSTDHAAAYPRFVEENSVDLPLINMRSKKITPRAIATHLGPGEPASHTEVLAAIRCNVARIHRPRCAEAVGPRNNTFPRRRAHP